MSKTSHVFSDAKSQSGPNTRCRNWATLVASNAGLEHDPVTSLNRGLTKGLAMFRLLCVASAADAA
jgi:hypothetical protein